MEWSEKFSSITFIEMSVTFLQSNQRIHTQKDFLPAKLVPLMPMLG